MPVTRSRPRPGTARPTPPRFRSVAELLDALGRVPPDRVLMDPPPGRATKRDLIRLHRSAGRRLELVDGTLIENTAGSPESYLAMELGRVIGNVVTAADLGFLYGACALIEVMPGLVRGPDVSFVSWAKRPEKTVPLEPVSGLIPDLVVEVLSPGNSRGEIARKLKEYFLGGVQLAWVIDPRKRSAEVYTATGEKTTLDESGTLDGGAVLPGFQLPLAQLFQRLEKPKPRKRKK